MNAVKLRVEVVDYLLLFIYAPSVVVLITVLTARMAPFSANCGLGLLHALPLSLFLQCGKVCKRKLCFTEVIAFDLTRASSPLELFKLDLTGVCLFVDLVRLLLRFTGAACCLHIVLSLQGRSLLTTNGSRSRFSSALRLLFVKDFEVLFKFRCHNYRLYLKLIKF